MKLFLRAVCAILILGSALRAQEADDSDDDDEGGIVDSSPDFSDLVIYVPKHTVTIGFRSLSGARTSFNSASIFGGLDPRGSTAGGDINHLYHDGYVAQDTSTATDASGGTTYIPYDGKSSNWVFSNASQVTTDTTSYVDNATGNQVYVGSGYLAMHSYVVDSTADHGSVDQDSKGTFGVELTSAYQMGRILGSKVTWQIEGGLSVNDLSSTMDRSFTGTVTTYTDYYSLDGYPAPTTTGATTYPIATTPLGRHYEVGQGEISDHFSLRGAYVTFRLGPAVVIPLFKHISFNVSTGGVLVYAGTNFGITEAYQPDTGGELVDIANDGASNFMPGFYFDANVQWDLTSYSGFYLGAVYQNSGTYTQTVEKVLDSTDPETSAVTQNISKYTTRVDLASLQGFRAGFLLKF